MIIPEVVTNANELFNNETLENLHEFSVMSDESAREQFDQLREHFDRRRDALDVPETTKTELAFFYIGRILHALGYTHSHGEPLPHDQGRVDYTLFESPGAFQAHEAGRGTSQLFAGGLSVLKLLNWGEPLDGEGGEATPDNPAFELDDILRQTGLQWAMLTNGESWRIYHRNTAGMLNTYYEVDLREILETVDFDAYKFFAAIFSKHALVNDGSGSSAARRMLA